MGIVNLGSQHLHIDVSRHADTAVVTLDGPLDAAQAGDLRAVVFDLIAGGVVLIVFDVGRLDFVDSAGLAVLAGAAGRLAPGNVVVRGAGNTLRRLLQITALDQLVTMRAAG